MLDIGFGGAAFAGLLSFFSPCVLPMVPFYLCYLAGISMSNLRDEGGLAPEVQRRIVIATIAFALGVTTIFMAFGLGATALGQIFLTWQPVLKWVAVMVLLAFGLHFLGVYRIGLLYRQARFEPRSAVQSPWGAYVMGLAFGFGWTPCIGPALAAILMLAAGSDDLLRGTALLGVYGVFMTAPFVLAAFFARPFLGWVSRHRNKLGRIEQVMGALLIGFAILIASDSVEQIAQAMLDWMPWIARLG